MVFFVLLFPFLGLAQAKQQMKDCVRPWQAPVMTVPTILLPSRPLECRPETPSACSRGRNSICQFSLKFYKYICCEDSSDQPTPLCPVHHDSLQLVCGSGPSHDSACPKGYKCLASRTNHDLRLCCRPNANVTHPEPDTTFRENRLVPQVLPRSPLHQLEITFGNTTLILGQLFDSSRIALLEKEPTVSASVLEEDERYVLVLVDSISKQLVWLAHGLSPKENKLELSKSTKTGVSYTPPPSDAQGLHMMVLVVYEQTGEWKTPKIDQDRFNFDEFEKNNAVKSPPIAGAFYAFMNTEDER